MRAGASSFLPTFVVFAVGTLWGLYWIPVRALAAEGVAGAWGTLLICLCAVLALLPFAIARRAAFAAVDLRAGAGSFLGGAAFALYSIGFVFDDVAIIALLFFLTPVWSTLIGKYILGWHTPFLRICAIVVGVLGLAIMLGADGTVPVPRGLGEWMALASGFFWAVSSVVLRTRPAAPPILAAFLFALGAVTCAAVISPLTGAVQAPGFDGAIIPAALIAMAGGGLWWALSMTLLLWAVPQLDPARVGILLMAEVLVGAATAAWLAGEHLGAFEIIGGGLVLLAGLLEVWPVSRRVVTRP